MNKIQLNIQFVEGLQTTTKRFDYDLSVDFPSQFLEICKLFQIPEIRREKHALQLHNFSGEYIDTTSKVTNTTFGNESVSTFFCVIVARLCFEKFRAFWRQSY